jgi:hypothetical protein
MELGRIKWFLWHVDAADVGARADDRAGAPSRAAQRRA